MTGVTAGLLTFGYSRLGEAEARGVTPKDGLRREESARRLFLQLPSLSDKHPLVVYTAQSEEARLAPRDARQALWRPGQRSLAGTLRRDASSSSGPHRSLGRAHHVQTVRAKETSGGP